MELRLLRRDPSARTRRRSRDGVISGTVRLDRRTKRLVGRLKPGNIAVIDHDDLDRIAAESLVERGVAAVVNVRPSVSSRYPNLGPMVLATAGVPILDEVGEEIFDRLTEGEHVEIQGEELRRDGEVIVRGHRLTTDEIRTRMDRAKAEMSEAVEHFAENTLDYVRREQDILLRAVRAPELSTELRGRHALVVTRGYHYKEDLHALRGYIREMHPVVVAVDGAADACLAEGIRPDIIFGDMDSVTTEALASGAELLVHGYPPDGVAPGLQTIEALDLPAKTVVAPGTSEDVAMLLAHEQGADLVVAVGSHTSLVEFLDKGREGMASTFLARIRLGPSLVDAKGVSQLYRTRIGKFDLLLLVLAAVLTMAVVSATVDSLQLFWITVWEQIRGALFQIRGWF